MGKLGTTFVVWVALVATQAVRAEVPTVSVDVQITAALPALPGEAWVDEQGLTSLGGSGSRDGATDDNPLANAANPVGLKGTAANVIELPPPPDSTTLFLSAMVSLGAWQLVRSARDFHFGAMPEWYHTGGPTQVGHATAFDLDFTSFTPCFLDTPTPQRPEGYHLRFDVLALWGPQRFMTACADPRGPPALAG